MSSPLNTRRWPLLVLTGAGASAPLKMPTTFGFVERLRADPEIDQELLDRVISVCQKRYHSTVIDIEAVLDHLAQFTGGVASITTESEHEGIELFAGWARDLAAPYNELRQQILGSIVNVYSDVDRDDVMRVLHPIVWTLINTLPVKRLPVFTLNYDLAIETYVDEMAGEVEIIDGFDRAAHANIRRWRRSILEEVLSASNTSQISRCVILFKLHGSTSWARDTISREIHQIGLTPKDSGRYQTLVHYPSVDAKPTFEEPFRTGFDYFNTLVQNTDKVIVLGTSFRDESVRHILSRMSHGATLIANGLGPEPSFLSDLRSQGVIVCYIDGDLGSSATRSLIIRTIVQPDRSWLHRSSRHLISDQPTSGLWRINDPISGPVLDGDVVAFGRDYYLVQDGFLRHVPDISTFQFLGFSWYDLRWISDLTFQSMERSHPLQPLLQEGAIIQVPGDERIFVQFREALSHIADVETLEILVPQHVILDGQLGRSYHVDHDVSSDTIELSVRGRQISVDAFEHSSPGGDTIPGTHAIRSILEIADQLENCGQHEIEDKLSFRDHDGLQLLILRMAVSGLISWTYEEAREQFRHAPFDVTLTQQGKDLLTELRRRDAWPPNGSTNMVDRNRLRES